MQLCCLSQTHSFKQTLNLTTVPSSIISGVSVQNVYYDASGWCLMQHKAIGSKSRLIIITYSLFSRWVLLQTHIEHLLMSSLFWTRPMNSFLLTLINPVSWSRHTNQNHTHPNYRTDRYCKQTAVLNGVTIPKGAIIAVPISVHVLHHSPLYWKDPEKFDPDRLESYSSY